MLIRSTPISDNVNDELNIFVIDELNISVDNDLNIYPITFSLGVEGE